MWIKLDDGFATHPKVLKAGPLGIAVQIRALCYASQNKTDGFIPTEALELMTYGLPAGMTERMLECGLWDQIDGGYQIHDYLHWNMSREQYDSVKESLSRAGKKGMKSRWKGHIRQDNPGYKVSNNPPNNQSITSLSISKSLNSLNSSSSEFEQFWQAYPRKTGKKAALNEWKKATDRPPLETVLWAISQQREGADWRKEGGKFIPHPSTWLHQGRWDDVPRQTEIADPNGMLAGMRDFLARGNS